MSKMRQVTIYTTDEEYSHFIQLAENLEYVKKIETDEASTKQEIVTNLEKGFEEITLIEKGKLTTTPLDCFLDAI